MIITTWHGTYTGRDAQLESMHPNTSDTFVTPQSWEAPICNRHGLLGRDHWTAFGERIICEFCRSRLDWGSVRAPGVRFVRLQEIDSDGNVPTVEDVPGPRELTDEELKQKAEFERRIDDDLQGLADQQLAPYFQRHDD
jgi:hypothetical protein